MDFHARIGLERLLEIEGLTESDLNFIGMIYFLERDPKIRVEPLGLSMVNYTARLSEKITVERARRLFECFRFPEPIRVNEIPAGKYLKDFEFLFKNGDKTYRIFVQNPRYGQRAK